MTHAMNMKSTLLKLKFLLVGGVKVILLMVIYFKVEWLLLKGFFSPLVQLLCSSKEKAKKSAFGMLGHRLVTKQTGPEGVVVNKVMVAKSVPITQEAYLSIFMDPSIGGPVFVACPLGGMDIEEIAAEKPELILKEPIDIEEGITHEQVSDIIDWIQFNEFASLDAFDIIKRLYEFFIKYDAIQIEINPFAQVSMSLVYSIDAKLIFDENAAFRHKEIFGLETTDELNEQEKLAKQYGLSYIPMDGNIACMVNGAGLAMATMDIIKLHGGLPANFLDVGGSATVEQVCNAFKIVASDPKIKAIFVNIFAGILRCDIVAEGVITACNELKIDIPVVLRLKGTKVDEAKVMLKNAAQLKGNNFEFVESFEVASKRVVELAGKNVETKNKKESCG
ncbi:Succinate--CoA ligase [ADP-forming] subunit beta, mitochondrial [Meloidogyne graminicola]|uniref:Succinyl-CoA synthetase beta chain n=1 Tax=Meloidogyne graminicola TaxID=189291 RepID=A0A8T0A2B0_9BILA|nr:Succinate--CoA ligase [ADP-forming] subunit beta, mitochondrial [Meloidogyne graminicola]